MTGLINTVNHKASESRLEWPCTILSTSESELTPIHADASTAVHLRRFHHPPRRFLLLPLPLLATVFFSSNSYFTGSIWSKSQREDTPLFRCVKWLGGSGRWVT